LKKIQLSNKAFDDLRKIGRYTQGRWGRQQRNLYLKKLDESFNMIAREPEIGTPCDYLREGYRKYYVNRHLIYYALNRDRVKIIRVLHQRMDVDSHLQ